MRHAKGCWANLPEGFGAGHLPSVSLDFDNAKHFLYRNASVIGLALAIAGWAIA